MLLFFCRDRRSKETNPHHHVPEERVGPEKSERKDIAENDLEKCQDDHGTQEHNDDACLNSSENFFYEGKNFHSAAAGDVKNGRHITSISSWRSSSGRPGRRLPRRSEVFRRIIFR